MLGKVCDSSFCARGSCDYNTTVTDGVTKYNQFCTCPSGYYGDRCEYRAYCDSNPCQNGGICSNKYYRVENSPDYISYYECECPTQYFGRHCERGNKYKIL